MNIVFFSHPNFLGSESMPRFAQMLMDGMRERGCNVSLLRPDAFLSRLPFPQFIRKWLAYFDQYVVFRVIAKSKVKTCSRDTLFVFTDQALGPWVPLVSRRPHVIHCHDFLAQNSAKGMIKEHPTGILGRCYQWYIRQGYSQGRHFISVSHKTREDLSALLRRDTYHSSVVYNGLNRPLEPHDRQLARAIINKHTGLNLSNGYVLHVGGNQWYKNRVGLVDIYDVWRSLSKLALPLLMVGKRPDKALQRRCSKSPFRKSIYPVANLPDELIAFAYSGANVLLFPSLAEGFGWPIAEAMACGCPVITTNARPMTEVAGGAAFLIPQRSQAIESHGEFTNAAAGILEKVLVMSPEDHNRAVAAGLANAKRFDTDTYLDVIENIYKDVLAVHKHQPEKDRRSNALFNRS